MNEQFRHDGDQHRNGEANHPAQKFKPGFNLGKAAVNFGETRLIGRKRRRRRPEDQCPKLRQWFFAFADFLSPLGPRTAASHQPTNSRCQASFTLAFTLEVGAHKKGGHAS